MIDGLGSCGSDLPLSWTPDESKELSGARAHREGQRGRLGEI